LSSVIARDHASRSVATHAALDSLSHRRNDRFDPPKIVLGFALAIVL